MEISIQLSPQAPRDVFTLIYAYLWSISTKIRSPPRLRKPFCFFCYYCVYRSSMCKYSCWFAGFCQDLGDRGGCLSRGILVHRLSIFPFLFSLNFHRFLPQWVCVSTFLCSPNALHYQGSSSSRSSTTTDVGVPASLLYGFVGAACGSRVWGTDSADTWLNLTGTEAVERRTAGSQVHMAW